MDVLPAEAQKLRQLMTAWSDHKEYELEATFGPKGTVDASVFFGIAQRLKAKGFEQMPQEDRLNIILPERIRVTLTGTGIIQQYCRDDSLQNKPFTAMIKDRTFVESNLDLDEYDTRIKVRREVEMAPDDAALREVLERWAVHRKAFRLIRRWSFKGKGVRFDLSMVRHTRKDARGEFKWVRTFKEQAFISDPPIYEVEVELEHSDQTDQDQATKNLISGIGEVLRGMQKNSIIIRKSQKERVLSGYKALTETPRFRGVQPVTMEVQNMTATIDPKIPNIRNGYNVTDKADGQRVLGYVDRRGELFMIDMGMNVYRTGLVKEACNNSLVDGEWITVTNKGRGISQLHLFDIYIAPNSEKVDSLPFFVPPVAKDEVEINSRYLHLKKWLELWMADSGPSIVAKGINDTNKLIVQVKNFKFPKNPNDIFRKSGEMLDMDQIYNTDGLILTSNSDILPSRPGAAFRSQFKWKPAHDNTIDFLVNFEKNLEDVKTDKINIGINYDTNETIRYKTLRLYVGSYKTAAQADPRAAVLFGGEKALTNTDDSSYRAILFTPHEFPDTMAATCYLKVERDFETGEEYVMTERSKEPIRDRSIVEMAYDPKREPGWRWIPVRVRHDKTERFLRALAMRLPNPLLRTANSDETASSVWNSIHDPVTEYMIRTGSEEPSEEEIKALTSVHEEMEGIGKVYYSRTAVKKDQNLVRGLRDFHNIYIKENILLRTALAGGGKKLLDIGCGVGGDLQKWRRGNVGFVLGIDPAGNNITNPNSGIYERYFNMLKEVGPENMPPMVFAIADGSKSLTDGVAGANPEERDILRSVFGRIKPENPIPPFVERFGPNALRDGADVITFMFTLHYFLESRETFNGMLNNINECLKVGGYVVGCLFDGDAVFQMLRGVPKGEAKIGKINDTPIWSIRKEYDVDDLSPDYDGLGMAIDVDFISIGTVNREFLVSFEFFTRMMRSIGCDLLTDEEAHEVGLQKSTNMFNVSYEMSKKAGKNYFMDNIVKDYSFLNRWFIFKRKSTKGIEEPTIPKSKSKGATVAAPAPAPTPMPIVTPTPSAGIPTAVPNSEEVAQMPSKTVKASSLTAMNVDKSFTPSELFQFSPDASQQDVLKINEPGAGRWLSLIAPFPIPDPDDNEVVYPSIEHYMAAMKYKIATNKPEIAKTMMSQEGKIHQKYMAQRLAESSTGARSLTADRENSLLKEEADEVKFESRPQAMVKFGALYDDGKWMAAKDRVLTDALTYRWMHDKRFRKIVEAVRDQNKYLLYYTGTASGSELGGKRRTADGRIDGANKVGKIIMNLANFPPF